MIPEYNLRKAIWTMKFSLDRKYFATAGEDGIINIWTTKQNIEGSWDGHYFGEEPFRSFKGHTVFTHDPFHLSRTL